MAYGTGCHKCGGYPGAGGPRERAGLYQCLNCGTFTCNQHLIGLVTRSCPACKGQKLKQVSSASKVARQSRQQAQLSDDKGGLKRKKQQEPQSKGGGMGASSGTQGTTRYVMAEEISGLGSGSKSDVKSYTTATVNTGNTYGITTKKTDVSEIMRHLTGTQEKKKVTTDGVGVLQLDPKNAKENPALDLDDVNELDFGDFQVAATVGVITEKPSGATTATDNAQDKPLGFWAEPDAAKRKARVHKLAQHDALFELESPQFYNDAIKRIANTHKARESACHLLALRLDNQPEVDISAHLRTFEEQVEPLFTSLQIRLLDGAPSMDTQVYRNLHEQHPSLTAVGPVYINTDLDKPKQEKMLKEAARLALEFKCPLYVSVRGRDEVNLPEILHAELEAGLNGVICSLVVDSLSLVMAQEHDWFVAIRPEHTYDENKDSREFISCLPFERIMLATGNEVNAPKLSRGHFNHPGFLRQTFSELQKLFDKKPEILRAQTNAAWRHLFLGDPAPKADK